MTAKDFIPFFRGLWGVDPYPWQVRLLEQVLEEGWPEAITLPTGSGKTAALDVAVFATALRPDHPRRVVYLVDRRIVVDQAEERARHVAQRLGEALGDPASPLHPVAKALAGLGDGVPLRVVKLRGGLPLPRHPIPDPAAPTVVLSTLDQAGSRLLFRGYGLSPRAWPVEAGLFAIDALFLLDEAHLERPAFHLLRLLEGELAGVGERLGRPGLRVVALTATPQTLGQGGLRALEPSPGDEKHLRDRWAVEKPLALKKVPAEELPEALAEAARKVRQQVQGPVVVFCNQVGTAREVFALLKKAGEGEVLLLTGRVRPFDRDRLLQGSLQGRLDGGEVAYVVATQALEVGADLDFSGMVTELCTLSALLQRLGRVGRRGRVPQAPVVVVRPEEASPRPYKGEALEGAWSWLEGIGQGADLGILGLRALLEGTPPPEAAWGEGPEPLPVPLWFLRLYALTDPFVEGLEPEPLLHGLGPKVPEVGLVFRKDILEGELEVWKERLDLLLPPSPYEVLPLPLWAARAFLEGTGDEGVSDLEAEEPGEGKGSRVARKALRLTEEGVEVVGPDDLRPGDTLLLPASYGGMDAYGYNPRAREAVRDVGEARPPGARPPRLLRLHPEVLRDALRETPPWLEERETPLGLLGEAFRCLEEGEEPLEQVKALAQALGIPYEGGDVETWLKGALGALLDELYPSLEPEWRTAWDAAREELRGGRAKILVHERYRGLVLRLKGESPSLGGARPETLEVHQRRVLEILEGYIERLCLPLPFRDPLRFAARDHDLGKLDPRMQAWLRLTAPPGDLPQGPLAKSGTRLGPKGVEERRKQAGYPWGQRHELVGAATLQGSGAHPLALHLIATHHGRGRPFPPQPPKEDRVLGTVSAGDHTLRVDHGLDRLDSGHAARFFALAQEYTPWGLAYLEALVRLADQQASGEVEDA